MKLTARVTGLERDKERGAVITGDIIGGGYFYRWPNLDGLALDDEVTVLVLRQDEAADLLWDLNDSGILSRSYVAAQKLADQLRPDAPDESTLQQAEDVTQEFKPPIFEDRSPKMPFEHRGRRLER